MISIPSLIRSLLTPPTSPGVRDSILWWEWRRLPVNLLVGAYGAACLLIYLAAINASHGLQPGEDAIEPVAVILAPIAFNICYTFGWLVEAPARALAPGLTPKLGPRLLAAGLVFTFCAIGLPAVFWAGRFLVHLLLK